jgi:hypothetical protein
LLDFPKAFVFFTNFVLLCKQMKCQRSCYEQNEYARFFKLIILIYLLDVGY